jgi:hypothetical protein
MGLRFLPVIICTAIPKFLVPLTTILNVLYPNVPTMFTNRINIPPGLIKQISLKFYNIVT